VPRVLGAAAVFAASRQTQAAVSDFASAQAIWYVGGGRGQERQAMSDRELPGGWTYSPTPRMCTETACR
jgi:hypothetical protein